MLNVIILLRTICGGTKIDDGQINQVINNLVINARQAMPDGGVITISTVNITRDEAKGIRLLKHTDYVEISVRDKGVGIEQQHIGRIFDPYFSTKDL